MSICNTKKKTDYKSDRTEFAVNAVTISVERVMEVIAMNKKGIRPDSLLEKDDDAKIPQTDYENVVGQDSVTRFDKQKRQKNNRRR